MTKQLEQHKQSFLQMHKILNHSLNLIPTLLLALLILVIPHLSDHELLHPTQGGKEFGFLWGIVGYVVIASIIMLIKQKWLSFKITLLDILLGAYVIMVCISYLLQPVDPLQMLIFGALVLFYLAVRFIHPKYYLYLMLAVILAGTIQAMFGNFQLYGFYPSHHGLFKMTGSFFNPGPYSGYLVSVLPIALGIYFIFKQKGSVFEKKNNSPFISLTNFPWALCIQYFALIAIVAIFLVLPASQSRASWLAVIVSGAYLSWKFRHQLKRSLPNSITLLFKDTVQKRIVISGGILLIVAGACTLYKFKQNSADGRLLIWKVSEQMIKDEPFFGHGAGKFKAHYMNYQAYYFRENTNANEAMLAGNTSYAFNEIIKLGVEHGIVGVLLSLSILGIMLFASNSPTSLRRYSDVPFEVEVSQTNHIVLLARGGIIGILVFGLFSYPSAILPIKMNFVLFAGIIASIYSKRNKKDKHKEPLHIFQGILKRYSMSYPSSSSCSVRKLPIFLSLTLLSILVLSYPAVKTINTHYLANHYWKDASDIYRIQAYQECLEDFELAYPQLKHNGDFLIQYGKALNMAGKHKKAIEMLEQAKQNLNNSILYTTLGDSQKNLGIMHEAEQTYLQASQMLPSRFFPLYLLAKFYDESGQKEKALKMANQLMNKEVKVPSKAIEEIKEEMQKIINNNEGIEPEAYSARIPTSGSPPSLKNERRSGDKDT